MKTNRFFNTIIALLSALPVSNAVAQSFQVSSIPYGNVISQTTNAGYTFTGTGSKAGLVKNGSGMITVGGTFSFQPNDTLYIGEGVNFNPEYISGFTTGCAIINNGTANISNAFFAGGRVDNYGTMSFGYFGASDAVISNHGTFSSINGCMLNATEIDNHGSFTAGFLGMNGDASRIVNSAEGTMLFTASVRIAAAGSLLQNEGAVKVNGFFNSNEGTVIENNGRMHLVADVTIGGKLVNKNMFITDAATDFQSTSALINTCRMVVPQLDNAGSQAENYGLLWITNDIFSSFTNSGTFKNAGYIRTTEMQNAAGANIINKVNNGYTGNQQKNGYIRIEGGKETFESVNEGAITGGNIADAHNAGFALDTNGANMTAAVMQINAFDTANYTTASFITCNCASPLTINEDTAAQAALYGAVQTGYNELQWTLTGTTPQAMELQQSGDGMDYAAMQSYSNAATAPAQYQDQQPATGVNYYRLKMTWSNNTVTFSNVVRLAATTGISNAAQPVAISSFPNPFNDHFNVSLNMTQQETVRVQVLDITGKVVSTVDFAALAGDNSFALTGLQNIAPAVYILQARALESGRTFQGRIVKQ